MNSDFLANKLEHNTTNSEISNWKKELKKILGKTIQIFVSQVRDKQKYDLLRNAKKLEGTGITF